jgi:hypothetical protein
VTFGGRGYLLPDHVVRATVDDEEVLLNMETGQYHLLNDTGRVLLQRLLNGDGPEDAAEWLRSQGAAEDEARRDLNEFSNRLVERGLLVVPSPDHG